MEAVKQIIDSDLLGDVISLPKSFQNKKVEVIVFLTDEKTDLPSLAKDDIDAMLKGSVTESLIGALPHSDVLLENYQAERLNKYDFEDSVQYVIGECISAGYIITRNQDDFSNSQIKVISPKEFINQIVLQN